MSTLTIRLPVDKHQRLRQLAKSRGLSVNKLMEELATTGLAELVAECRFRALEASGSLERGLVLLDKLDKEFGKKD